MIRALVGEVLSQGNLDEENRLSGLTIASANINTQIANFITRLSTWHGDPAQAQIKAAASKKKGRYAYYYSGNVLAKLASVVGIIDETTIGAALANPPSDMADRIALVADYAHDMRHHAGAGAWDVNIPANLSAARRTPWNTDEAAAWTQLARQQNVPLSAGPSATTALVLALAQTVGATQAQKDALAWAIFAFFNRDLKLHKSGTHRFHEVMAIAANYGVHYVPWAYPANPP